MFPEETVTVSDAADLLLVDDETISQQTIYQHLVRAGVQMRPSGRRPKAGRVAKAAA